MTDYQAKFQKLLRELFQFDVADLDFRIYRIMNHKRQVIERFVSEDLPKAIMDELAQGALAEGAQAAKDLDAARKKVLDALGEDALDAVGNLADSYHNTKAGKEYIAAQENAKSSKSHGALEATIYNHLYTFFSRYYQDGDFISKRRYSRKERYAIPYKGEEVHLYWANHDQYYVKTGEYFTDYTWQAPNGVAVHFKLKAADVEQNNIRGEKRFFLPHLDEMEWNESASQLTIPYEFRPLTEQENIKYGKKNQQEAINIQAATEIPKKLSRNPLALTALTAEKRQTDKGETLNYLEHHLRQYTRRNTSDFFIHIDLQGFLSRELDFYLKNEVLNLEEMEIAGEGMSQGWFQLLRLIKKVGNHIITFLAQIENFQYMLNWETRKSETLLNVEKLAKPFAYQLRLHRDGETRAQPVDLPETFNYLIGLFVETRQALDGKGRRYLAYRGVTREGRNTAVLWRETEGWNKEDYIRDSDFVAKHKLAEGAEEVFVNGDSFIPGAQALESLFKARMFAGTEE